MKTPFLSASHSNNNIVERIITVPNTCDTIEDDATPGTTMTSIIRHIEIATKEISDDHNPDEQKSNDSFDIKAIPRAKQSKTRRGSKLETTVPLQLHQTKSTPKIRRSFTSPRLAAGSSRHPRSSTSRSPSHYASGARSGPNMFGGKMRSTSLKGDDEIAEELHRGEMKKPPGPGTISRSIPEHFLDLGSIPLVETNVQHPQLISRPNIQSLQAKLSGLDWPDMLQAPRLAQAIHTADRKPDTSTTQQLMEGKHSQASNTSSIHSTTELPQMSPCVSTPIFIHRSNTEPTLHQPHQARAPLPPPRSHLESRYADYRIPKTASRSEDGISTQLANLQHSLSKCHLDITSRLDRVERKLDLALNKLEAQSQSRSHRSSITNKSDNKPHPTAPAAANRPIPPIPTKTPPPPSTPSGTRHQSHHHHHAQTPRARVTAVDPSLPAASSSTTKRRKGKLSDGEKVIRSNLVGMPPHVPFGGMEGWYERVKRL